MRRFAVVLVLLTCITPTALADHQMGHEPPPGPAPARFPKDFPVLKDSEWSFRLGGFGGSLLDDAEWDVHAAKRPERHHPVIFVHGNNVDAADWYPTRDAFIAAGWDPDDLWALSYNGLGAQSGAGATPNERRDQEHLNNPDSDFVARVTNNDVNVPDVYRFITAVRRYRQATRFSIVAHSLGVTLARRVLKLYPHLRRDVVSFVGIAGGNHGTSLCPPGSEGELYSCDEIAKGTAWLAKLNGPLGSDETYRPVRWLVIYDGSGYRDVAFMGPDYAQSPVLKGAVNCSLPHDHNDLRGHPAAINLYRKFVELAERGTTDRDCR